MPRWSVAIDTCPDMSDPVGELAPRPMLRSLTAAAPRMSSVWPKVEDSVAGSEIILSTIPPVAFAFAATPTPF
jgi:hypothetical protein